MRTPRRALRHRRAHLPGAPHLGATSPTPVLPMAQPLARAKWAASSMRLEHARISFKVRTSLRRPFRPSRQFLGTLVPWLATTRICQEVVGLQVDPRPGANLWLLIGHALWHSVLESSVALIKRVLY